MKNSEGTADNLKLYNEDGIKIYEYYKFPDGYSLERTYGSNGKILTYKNSNGYSYEFTYDSKGNELTYENSNGHRRGFDVPKKEAIEEAAENYGWKIKTNSFSDKVKVNELAESSTQDFIEGAKWQQERMYSEEDMQEYAEFCIVCNQKELPCIIAKDWFEQFKKKIK
jgi:YD repeat-containing protein